MPISRHYLSLGEGRQVHYRFAGEGAPLILLHPSPQHSGAMVPAISAFSRAAACIALDTPGYGRSDDWLGDHAGMGDYAEAVFEIADALGLDRFAVYGAATGAQIAIEMNKRRPDRLVLTLLDSNGHMEDDERDRMVEGYFPDVAPRRYGGHLLTYWDMCRNLFTAFPWHSTRVEDRLGLAMPPAEMIHQIMLRYLLAGEDYAKAYRPAFYTETREHMNGMSGRATMMLWQGSPVARLGEALVEKGLPECVQLLRAGPSLEERYGAQVDALRGSLAEDTSPPIAPFTPPELAQPVGWSRDYLTFSGGQLHCERRHAGEGKLLVVLHGAGQSARQLRARMGSLDHAGPALLLDLPGHGGSDALDGGDPASIDELANGIGEALRAANLGSFDIAGYGLGAAVAAKLDGDGLGERLTVIDPPVADMLDAASLPDLSPTTSGTHLIEAWTMVRDAASYEPFQARTPDAYRAQPLRADPQTLHERVVDVLALGASWRDWATLEAGINWPELLGVHPGARVVATDYHPDPSGLEQKFDRPVERKLRQ